MYTVRYRRELDLLDITWAGYFGTDEFQRYAEACYDEWRRERFLPGYRLRIHLQDDTPLPQDSLRFLEHVFDDFPAAGRTAMVTGSALCSLQIKRTMMVPTMQIFEDPDVALDWLLAP